MGVLICSERECSNFVEDIAEYRCKCSRLLFCKKHLSSGLCPECGAPEALANARLWAAS